VRVYGGTKGSEVRAYYFGLEGAGFSNMQMLATRGYAVLYPDIPQRVGTPMRDIAAAVLPAVDKVIELGIADPERLGVFGQSYGGYSTISLLVQTSRFKGALMSAGLADLVSNYGTFSGGSASGIGWSETGQALMVGTPWEYRERYLENSPIFYLDRVTTPLLIVHGDRDEAVSVAQGDEVFVGLRRLGKEVEYRRYGGEGHVPQGRANVADYWNAVIGWFDRWVKGSVKGRASD
jgi:dipeptidyl aminopeptidase/acylaminoacyl peptidase